MLCVSLIFLFVDWFVCICCLGFVVVFVLLLFWGVVGEGGVWVGVFVGGGGGGAW